jgi:DNA-directed RNA polymerase subunit L
MAESQSKSKTTKNTHITNIRYPYAKTWDKLNTSVEFELANIHFSTSNAIRRLMLSGVKSVGFRTEPYTDCDIEVKENDTPLHNQFILHRLGMIPINVPKPDTFNVDDFEFIIDISNNTNENRLITTEDFQIKQISTNKMLPREEVKKFFPPDPITGDYILLNKLRPKYFVAHKSLSSEVIKQMNQDFNRATEDVMQFHIVGKASISNGTENGHYCPVACACYINTVDPERAKEGLRTYIDKHMEETKSNNTTPMSHEALARRFELTERSRFYYINDRGDPNVFTFKIETVGVIPPLIVFHRSIDILKDKINHFLSNLVSKNENEIEITPSKQLNDGFDLKVKNEDDTLGAIIQSHLCMLYADFALPKEQRLLTYIGYKRPHPLENHIIFVIQGKSNKFEEIVATVIKPGCAEIIKMLNKIQNELEGTSYFVKELKAIQ